MLPMPARVLARPGCLLPALLLAGGCAIVFPFDGRRPPADGGGDADRSAAARDRDVLADSAHAGEGPAPDAYPPCTGSGFGAPGLVSDLRALVPQESSGIYHKVAIRTDSLGRPRVAFLLDAQQVTGIGSFLQLATWDPAAKVFVRDKGYASDLDNVIQHTWVALALDSRDNVLLAYHDYSPCALRCDVYSSGGWSTDQPTSAENGTRMALAISGNDRVLLVFNKDPGGGELFLATSTSPSPPAGVAPIRADGAALDGNTPALAIDDQQRLHLVYNDQNIGGLSHAVSEDFGKSWTLGLVEAGAPDQLQQPSLAWDAGKQRLHVAYFDRYAGAVCYAEGQRLSGGSYSWRHEEVDSAGARDAFPSLAVSPRTGEVSISYALNESGTLKVTRGSPGAWVGEPLPVTQGAGSISALAINQRGEAFLIYVDLKVRNQERVRYLYDPCR